MKYIDAEKLKERTAKLEADSCLSEYKDGFDDGVGCVLDIIDSLQQERPSLPSNLNEAAFDYAELCKYEGADKLLCAEHFKAGAEWMAEQGEILEGEVVKDINNRLGVSAKGFSGAKIKFGDRVIVQIRKKEE